LLEGTNLSEGRGTTRPFEIFGAPYLKHLPKNWVDYWNNDNPEAVLRPLMFIPAFHKHKDKVCYGFQLHPIGEMHSLLYALKMLRSLKKHARGFKWLEGPYEAGSERAAIDLLAGDQDILQFLEGNLQEASLLRKLKEEEKNWIALVQPFLIYSEPLYTLSITA
jgi:uncharacterized protein YbbC (DUF1343 family)